MREIIKLAVAIGIGLSFVPLLLIVTKHSNFFYWWFAGVYIYLFWIIEKNRKLMGYVSFLLLGLSLIISILNLSELAKIISIFSFIGAISFLLCDYITEKNE